MDLPRELLCAGLECGSAGLMSFCSGSDRTTLCLID